MSAKYEVNDMVLCVTKTTEKYRKSRILEICVGPSGVLYKISFWFWIFPCRTWTREDWIHGLIKRPLTRKELKKLDKLAKD